MALIKCPECSNDISDSAKSCPHCGYRIKNPRDSRNRLVLIVSVAALLLLAMGIILTINMVNNSKEKKEQQRQEELRLRGADENAAEEFRHAVEIIFCDREIYEELYALIGNNETVLIRWSKRGVEYCVNAQGLKDAVEDTFSPDFLSGNNIKSKKYGAKVFVVTVTLKDKYSTPNVQGTWK